MGNRTAQELWQDYLFLTKEMIKFLEKPDMNLFYELMNQRERLQPLIEQNDDKNYRISKEGQGLFSEIQQVNEKMNQILQLRYNSAKHHRQVAEIYSGVSAEPFSNLSWER